MISLKPSLLDGYLVLCAALARGCDLLLLPRQVLLAAPIGEEVGLLSFVNGVPQSSTVAAVTHAHDKRLRRVLLNRAGLPTPPGITFSSRGKKQLQQFVLRQGYPLVLKQAIGENPAVKVDNISNERELLVAISQMRLRTEEQLSPVRSLVASAYAEDISSVADESGVHIASPGTRLLLEKRVRGCYIRCLVLGNRLVAAVELNGNGPSRCADRTNSLHSGFKDLAVQAASVIPGLTVAAIDFVVEDPSGDPCIQTHYIVELCERPQLASFRQADPALGIQLADALLVYEADRSSIPLQNPVEHVAVRMRAESLWEPDALLPRFRETCQGLGLSGAIELTDPLEGIVEARVQGKSDAVALILEALSSGIHFGQRAMAIDIHHC